jgi:ssDNA-binding Zn-finger/Zn-ribbon topoisomerase 1
MFGFRRRRRKQKFDDYTLDWIANLGDDCPKCSHRLRLESDRGDGKPEAYCDACGYGENPWYSWKQTECPKCTDPHAVEQVGQGNYFLDCDRCSHREYSIS